MNTKANVQNLPTTENERPSLIRIMANKFNINDDQFKTTVLKTCFPKGQATNEELAAFLMVANEYNLNPLTKEIYAFQGKGGGIVTIVSIDGWMNLINSHPQFNGMQFEDHLDEKGNLSAITCKIYRRDREYPIEVTEYMAECSRQGFDTWEKWPRRMLRHKASIQCARYAFGFAGIYDPDEGERIKDVNPAPINNSVKEKARSFSQSAKEAIDVIDDEKVSELVGRLEIVAGESGMSGLEKEWKKLENEERAALSSEFKRIREIAECKDNGIDPKTGELFE